MDMPSEQQVRNDHTGQGGSRKVAVYLLTRQAMQRLLDPYVIRCTVYWRTGMLRHRSGSPESPRSDIGFSCTAVRLGAENMARGLRHILATGGRWRDAFTSSSWESGFGDDQLCQVAPQVIF